MSETRVVVAGWTGAGNLGDELLLRALRRRLEVLGAGVVATSANPAETVALHGVEAIGSFDVRRLASELDRAAAMIFGPGGIIQDQTSVFSLPSHLWRVTAARAKKVPVIGYGLGAVPLEWRLSRVLLRRALSGIPLVVRDAESGAVLRECGLENVQVTADLVFGLTGTSAVQDRIVVAPRPFSPGRFLPSAVRERHRVDPRVEPLAAAVQEAGRRMGLPVHFVAFQPERDLPFIEAIADRLTIDVTVSQPSLDDVFAEVGSGRVVIAMRYHAGVTAVACGRPSVFIGYSPKVSSLAARIRGGVELIPDDPQEFGRIGALAESVAGEAAAVADAAAELRRLEQSNADLLERFMSQAGRL